MSLYEILFGNKDIPMTNEVSFDPDAKTVIIGAALILTFGAVIVAKLVTDKNEIARKKHR